MDDIIGKKIDGFQILGVLGNDAWGDLYQATDPEAGRQVALHFLSPAYLSQAGAIDHFTKIIHLAKDWQHPAIIKVFGIQETESATFVIREYIAGAITQDLLELLREHKKIIPYNEAIYFVRQILLALEFIHQRGIIHGDLGPHNIYLREEPSEGLLYQPVMVNFGLNLPGSPFRHSLRAYEPPEQAAGKVIDTRSDIYTAGMLLYELATGRMPTFESGPLSQGDQLLPPSTAAASLRLPHIIRPDLPDELEKIILRASAAKPEDRYQNAEAMVSDLAEALIKISKSDTAPKGSAEITSLLWANTLSKSGLEMTPVSPGGIPLPSEADQFQESQDRIHFLLADKTIHTVTFNPPVMSIGRSADNDIVLNQSGVSRHHARIEFDGESYWIVDLNSRNGTYFGHERLKPNSQRLWIEGENVRVGDTWLRLERFGQGKSTIAAPTKPGQLEEPDTILEPALKLFHPDGEAIDPTQIKFSTGEGRLGVYLESPNLTVPPGGQASTSLMIINRADYPDEFRIAFVGVPLDWIPNRPQSISLQSNSQRFLRISFQPPRSTDSRAGRQIVTIRITSQKESSQAVEVRLAITISAFAQFTSEVTPKRLKPGASGQVKINNQGNLPENFSVGWDTKRGDLTFEPSIAKITLPPGNSGTVNFRIKATQRQLFGNGSLRTFGTVISSQSGQFQTHKGEFADQPLIPMWAPIILAVFCLGMTCLGFIISNQLFGADRRASETVNANQTVLALDTQNAGLGTTGTAQAFANATQSANQASTATAIWLEADDDQDGLPNTQEFLFNTKPDQADTDQDGLKDGEEIQTYKTNPLMPDSDGDSIKDGAEIEKKLNPLVKDTDGDGLEDGFDPDPLNPATKTPTRPSATVSATNPTTTRVPVTDLSIYVDSGTSTAVPGTSMTYTLRIRNNGPSHVANAQVVDVLPDALVNISWTCLASSGSFCRGGSGFGNLDMRVDLLVGGEITFIISANVSPSATGQLINSATISPPENVLESNTNNNLATDSDILTPKASFTLSISDNRTEVLPGQNNVYSIQVTNNGPSTAAGVVVTNLTPNALTALSWTCTSSAGSICQPTGTQTGNVNTTSTIRPGGSVSITTNTRVKDRVTGVISNTANLSSPINPGTNNTTATDFTNIIPVVDLEVNVDAPDFVNVSSTITYTLNITNTGPAPATDIVLINDLPFSATFDSSTPPIPICEHMLGTVTCELGNLAPGASLQVTITILVPDSTGSITNQAEVSANEQDLELSDNVQQTVVQIR